MSALSQVKNICMLALNIPLYALVIHILALYFIGYIVHLQSCSYDEDEDCAPEIVQYSEHEKAMLYHLLLLELL